MLNISIQIPFQLYINVPCKKYEIDVLNKPHMFLKPSWLVQSTPYIISMDPDGWAGALKPIVSTKTHSSMFDKVIYYIQLNSSTTYLDNAFNLYSANIRDVSMRFDNSPRAANEAHALNLFIHTCIHCPARYQLGCRRV